MNEAQSSTALALRACVPTILALLLAILTLLPVGDGTGDVPVPHLTLMLVYYWSIHRPEFLPPVIVALIGLFQDLLWMSPPGLNMLVLLCVQVLLTNQQAIFTRGSFLIGWIGFTVVAAMAMALSWVVASFYYEILTPLRPLLGHWLMTVAAYPLMGWVFGRVDKALRRR